ncbi:MAG: ATP-binding protein [Anaerolineales bacterium]
MTATSPLPPTPTQTSQPEEASRSQRITDGAGDPDCPHCHGLGYVRQDWPVGHPNFGKIQACVCQLENMQMERAAQLREESNTETLTGKTFDTFLSEGVSPDPDIRATVRAAYERCRAFADQPEKWLVLTGTYGCGKTHLAAAIANYGLAHGQPVLFLNTPDLLDYLRASFAPSAEASYNERFEEIRTAPLLILDDLGTESPTNWATEKLYQILNYRYNARLPTVITTNKDLKELDQRVASRLSDAEIVSTLNILAPDFRAGKLNQTSDISTLLIHHHQTFESFDLRPDLTGEARQSFLAAIRSAQEFADDPRGWLVLIGPYGSGKTHLAAAMGNYRTQVGKPIIFVAYQDLSELFRSTSNRETDDRNTKLVQQVRNIEFLILDDLPSLAGTTGYFREKFFQIFNYRFDAQLPTVITTAAEEKELDPRIKSRIFYSDFCQVHVLKATAYRGKKKGRRNPKSQ